MHPTPSTWSVSMMWQVSPRSDSDVTQDIHPLNLQCARKAAVHPSSPSKRSFLKRCADNCAQLISGALLSPRGFTPPSLGLVSPDQAITPRQPQCSFTSQVESLMSPHNSSHRRRYPRSSHPNSRPSLPLASPNPKLRRKPSICARSIQKPLDAAGNYDTPSLGSSKNPPPFELSRGFAWGDLSNDGTSKSKATPLGNSEHAPRSRRSKYSSKTGADSILEYLTSRKMRRSHVARGLDYRGTEPHLSHQSSLAPFGVESEMYCNSIGTSRMSRRCSSGSRGPSSIYGRQQYERSKDPLLQPEDLSPEPLVANQDQSESRATRPRLFQMERDLRLRRKKLRSSHFRDIELSPGRRKRGFEEEDDDEASIFTSSSETENFFILNFDEHALLRSQHLAALNAYATSPRMWLVSNC